MARGAVWNAESWIITEDDAMSIKREDLDAGRIDFADVSSGRRLAHAPREKFCVTIFCGR